MHVFFSFKKQMLLLNRHLQYSLIQFPNSDPPNILRMSSESETKEMK